ncbi:hypothetical protein SNE40_022871 [Patella caerulea]|uniref:Uncharacterized protein n=1 Tax=Patella caerulea TaxID=87958 RepID=A0AAN8G550_PATCE
MKFAVALLVLLPLAFAAPMEKRFFMEDLSKLFDITTLKANVQAIATQAGSDATEAQCEITCHKVIPGDVIGAGCPLICKSFQSLVSRFNIV